MNKTGWELTISILPRARTETTTHRVGEVPEGEFEEAVDSQDPPSVIELAERGRGGENLTSKMTRDAVWAYYRVSNAGDRPGLRLHDAESPSLIDPETCV